MTDYTKPVLDLSPGGVNYVYPIVYEFTGYRIKQWKVAKATEKTYMLIMIDQPDYGRNYRRLLKKDIDKAGWRGDVFTFDKSKAIENARAYLRKEEASLAKLRSDIEASILKITGEKP